MTFWSASMSVYHSVMLLRKGMFVQFPVSLFSTVMFVMVTLRCVRFTGASVSMITSVPSFFCAVGGCVVGSCIPETRTAAIMTTLAMMPTVALSPICRGVVSIAFHG